MRTLYVALLAATLAAAADSPVPLWPNAAPGEKGGIGPETDTSGPNGALVSGRKVIRLGGVSTPTLAVYRPPKEKDSHTAVLVFPGGGYNILAMDLEGTEICEWLNSIGVTGVLVKYRVPARPGQPRWAAPLQDAQRALGMVRKQASELGLDPKRIGVLGFSAGGHLAAALSTNFDHRTYDPIDDADTVSCRPDFTLLVYPAYLTVKEEGDKVAPELKITGETPPTFLVQAEDDGVRVETSLFYYAALRNAPRSRGNASLSERRPRLWAAHLGKPGDHLAGTRGGLAPFPGGARPVTRLPRAMFVLAMLPLSAAAQYTLYTCMVTSKDYVVGAKLPPSGIFVKPENGPWRHAGYNHPFINALDYDSSRTWHGVRRGRQRFAEGNRTRRTLENPHRQRCH